MLVGNGTISVFNLNRISMVTCIGVDVFGLHIRLGRANILAGKYRLCLSVLVSVMISEIV